VGRNRCLLAKCNVYHGKQRRFALILGAEEKGFHYSFDIGLVEGGRQRPRVWGSATVVVATGAEYRRPPLENLSRFEQSEEILVQKRKEMAYMNQESGWYDNTGNLYLTYWQIEISIKVVSFDNFPD
jgi:hypothetical protein